MEVIIAEYHKVIENAMTFYVSIVLYILLVKSMVAVSIQLGMMNYSNVSAMTTLF